MISSLRGGRNPQLQKIEKAAPMHPKSVAPGSRIKALLTYQRRKNHIQYLLSFFFSTFFYFFFFSSPLPLALKGRHLTATCTASPSDILRECYFNDCSRKRLFARSLFISLEEEKRTSLLEEGAVWQQNSSIFINLI